jgi:fibronectin-binding autotransporter adhesin
MKRIRPFLPHAACTGLLILAAPAAHAASGNWTNLAGGNWSAAASWNPNAVPGTAAGDTVGITANITAARTVTIDTTSRTVGTLNIGDPGSSYFAYTLAASGGATLTFNNSGSGANLVQATTTAADIISAPLVLADNLTINNTGSGGITLSGVISGGAGFNLTKIGSGLLILGNGANTYAGKTILRAGDTRIASANSFGPTPAGYVADQITLDGGSLVNNNNEPVITVNQGITLGASGGLILAGWTKPITINSVITGFGGLTIRSDVTPGPIILNGFNTYQGPTQVGSSTAANQWAWLLVNGSLDPASFVTVITNGSLGGNGTVNGYVQVNTNGAVGPGGLAQPGTLTINNSAAMTEAAWNFDLADVTTVGGGVNDLLEVNGSLTLSGVITVNPVLLKGSLVAGTYRLVNYTGTLDASGATLVCSNPQFGATFDLSTPGQINMTVATGTPLNLTWGGAAGPLWDTTTTNWLDGANPTKFTQADGVRFDDSGSYFNPAGLYQLNLLGPLASADALLPAYLAVDTTNNFVITSVGTAGRLGGAMALYKSGTGTLTMAHGNDNLPNLYTGPTVITDGVLKVNTPRVLGPVTGGAIIATNGGTFDLNAQAMGLKRVVMEGAGFNSVGAVINSGGGQNNALQAVTMTGDATVGGTGRFDIRGTPVDTFLNTGGQPYKLTKVGPQQFSLVGVTVDPALGDIDVREGTLSFESTSTSLGDPSKTLHVRPNATFLLWGATNLMDKQFALNGGTTANVNNGSGSNTIVGPITLNADSTFSIAGTSLALYGAIGGPGGLIKAGTSPLFLHTANSYSGNTYVNAGTLTLGSAGWIGTSPLINVASGATLDASPVAAGLLLNTGQMLAGSGTVKGTVTVPTGTAVSPGSSPGTLSITNLVLDGGTGVFELGPNPATTAANDRILAGNLSVSSLTTLKLVPLGPLDTVNPYTLITNLGTALPSGTESSFTVTSPSRYTFSVVPTDSSAGTAVQVQVSGGAPANLVWQGNDATNPTWWDTSVTSNWLNGASSDAFFAGDAVQFDDTAIGTTASLIGLVQPSFIRLANATKPILIDGTGNLSTPSLSDEGGSTTTIANTGANTFINGVTNVTGTLTLGNIGANNFGVGLQVKGGTLNLANTGDNLVGPVAITGGDMTVANSGANTFGAIALTSGTLAFNQPVPATVGSVLTGAGTLVKQAVNTLTLSGVSPAFAGPIQVNTGTLKVGAGTSLGYNAPNAGTTIGTGATLDVNGITISNEVVTVEGAGVGGLGAIVNSGASQVNALKNVVLAGDAVFGGLNRWDIRINALGSGSLTTSGNPYRLRKVGANQISLVSVTVDPALADIDVAEGMFGYELATSGLGDPARTLNVASNATFLMYAPANPLNKQLRLQGGSRLLSQSAAGTVWGPIELPNAMASIQTDVNLTVTNQVSGPGALQKIGTATLFLNASNNLTSSILVTNGTLTIGHPEALGSSGMVYVRRNATTGGAGPKLGLAGGISTPATMAADFTTAPLGGGDYRCSMGSDAGGANTWNGPILLNGAQIVGFYTSTGNPLIINGNIYGTNGYTGQVFCRGAAGVLVTINGQVNLPAGRFALTDNAVVAVNSVGNVWVTTQSAFGRLVVGADNALCPTAGMILGQPNSAAFLDLNGWTQEIGSLATAGTASSQTIGSSSLTADSTLIFNGTTNLSTYGGKIVDSVAGGTRKVSLRVTSGRLQLDAANTYSGTTTISGGTLALGAAGTIPATPVIDVQTSGTLDASALGALPLAAGQTLMGNGTVTGSVAAGTGSTVAAGASIGALTLTGNLQFDAGSTSAADVDKSATPNCDVVNAASITYGGTLVVNNLGPAIALGDSFKLFNASSYSGSFAAIVPATPGPGLAWDTTTLAVDGTLRVWALTLTGITKLPDGNFALTIEGSVGQPYSVLASSDVALPLATWTVLTNGTIPTVPFVFEDLTATNYPIRFYRTSTP